VLKKQIKSVTLIEILTVIIIIGILVSLALPKYGAMKERALDKEARANLKLIQAAEKIYRMEYSQYWSCNSGDEDSDTRCVNTNLRLDLPVGRNWNYSTTGGATLDAQAARNDSPSGWDRTYSIDHDDEEACCTSAGEACYPPDECP
jgi:type II secretory pathway pseudopilin PulG